MSIWETLSKVDCNEHIEKKGQFSYLAWTWAWAMVKERYADASYTIEDDLVYPDTTMEVRCTITIEGLSHTMWLPVLDFKNKAIESPDAFDINSSRMRCLVKCCAMFGLGHYIYAGESLPQQGPEYTEEQKAALLTLLAEGNAFGLRDFYESVGQETMDGLFNSAPKGQKTRFKDEVRALYSAANEDIKLAVAAIQTALSEDSADSVAEVFAEMGELEEKYVNKALSETEHQKIELLRAA
jgi:hypothetical protein